MGGYDLPAVRGGGDARGSIHVDADKARCRGCGLSRMEPHPDVDLDAGGPWLGGKGPLCLDGRGDCLDGAVEDDEEGVALGALLVALMPRDCRAHERSLALEHQ